MTARIGIVGASGYGGAELLRLVDGHPELQLGALAAHSRAGEPVAGLYPNLVGHGTFGAVDPDRLAADHDLVVLATPTGAALELAGGLVDAGTPVVDLSGGHRLGATDFQRWYGREHPRPDLVPATYGLTEFNREALADTALVANPGCYPSAALLGLLPLLGLLDRDDPGVVVDAKSGTSGAGRGPAEHLHFSHVHGDLTAYGAPAHRHTGELEHGLWTLGRLAGVWPGPPRVSFTPHLVPMSRGLLATCYGTAAAGVDAADVQEALADAYADEPFVQVLEPGTFPNTKAVAGSNGCRVSAVLDERTGRVTATSVIDNLGKGAAGQALQNINLMLGCEETLGLTAEGVYP